MVFLSKVFCSKLRKYLREGIRDSLRIYVAGGCGGNGLPKFGGSGGNGGNIKLLAKENVNLDDVYKKNKSRRYEAKHGRNSSHNFILGPPGEDISIEVPVGVTAQTDYGMRLGELNEDGQELTVAKGGAGGHAKNGYLGTKGQMYHINLDLKLIADIGLVGFPNAGKSTLLNALSNAKAKVASYPFTTIRPNVGVLKYSDLRQISMADLPGLIEGAHANRGMGHNFLKHVERTKLILFVVDINGFRLNPQYEHRSCLESVLLLNKEIELYNKTLLNKPSMLIVNKMDSADAQNEWKKIEASLVKLSDAASLVPVEMRPSEFIKFSDIIPISAKHSKDDIEKVKVKLRLLLDVFTDLQKKKLESENSETFKDFKDHVTEKSVKFV